MRLARCGHAFLVLGRTARLRREGARKLAAQLLHSAGLTLDTAHLDLFVARPEEEKSQIGIDACRALIRHLALTPAHGFARVGVIEPAWALTAESQNALLKFVEDPGPYGKMLFLGRRREDLLPTLRSRCLLVQCPGKLTADDVPAAGQTPPEELLAFLNDIDSTDLAQLADDHGVSGQIRALVEKIDDESAWSSDALQPFHKIGGSPDLSDVFISGCIAGAAKKMRQAARTRQASRWQRSAELLLAMNRELRYHPNRSLLVEAARKAVFNPYAGSPV